MAVVAREYADRYMAMGEYTRGVEVLRALPKRASNAGLQDVVAIEVDRLRKEEREAALYAVREGRQREVVRLRGLAASLEYRMSRDTDRARAKALGVRLEAARRDLERLENGGLLPLQ